MCGPACSGPEAGPTGAGLPFGSHKHESGSSDLPCDPLGEDVGLSETFFANLLIDDESGEEPPPTECGRLTCPGLSGASSSRQALSNGKEPWTPGVPEPRPDSGLLPGRWPGWSRGAGPKPGEVLGPGEGATMISRGIDPGSAQP